MTCSRAWRRPVGGIVFFALVLLVIAGAANVTDAPTSPTSQPSLSSFAAPETISATAPPSRECMGTVSAGSIDLTGSGSTVIGPEGTSFSCGMTNPLVSIRVVSSAVTFTTAGAPVTITNGSSATVGPYQITVLNIEAGTAMFKVVAPS